MAVNTDPIGRSLSLPIDTAETIALFKLPGGSIERRFDASVLVSPDESFDYRVDVGVLPEGVDEPEQESDIDWYEGAISKTKDSAADEKDDISVSSTYVRVVVTTAGTAGATTDLAFTIGR